MQGKFLLFLYKFNQDNVSQLNIGDLHFLLGTGEIVCRSSTAGLVLLSERVVKKDLIKCYLIFNSVIFIFASLKELKRKKK